MIRTHAEPSMVPIRVTAYVRGAIVTPSTNLGLDGLLGAALAKKSGDYYRGFDGDHIIEFELPLAKWTAPLQGPESELTSDSALDSDGKLWGWCGSNVTGRWIADETVYVRRPTPITKFAQWDKDPAKVNISGMRYKAHNKAVPARLAASVTWYAVGDPSEVHALLTQYIRNLGKLSNHGHGSVIRWEVVECESDWSLIRDGRPMRGLPLSAASMIQGPYRTGMIGLRPPNWHRLRQTLGILADYQPTALDELLGGPDVGAVLST